MCGLIRSALFCSESDHADPIVIMPSFTNNPQCLFGARRGWHAGGAGARRSVAVRCYISAMRLRPALTLRFLPTLFVLACDDPKPPAAIVQLAPGADTLAVAYREVTGGAWLGDNRWAIVAPRDGVVDLVDLSTRTATPLDGRGGRELQSPFNVFIAVDTLHVGDWARRRLTLWSPDGRFARFVPAFDAARGAIPQARDAAGNFYLEVAPPPRSDGSGNRDSAAVLRAGAGGQLDTIARLAPLDLAEVQGNAGRRFERRVFSGTDHWGVLPDGSLWVARVSENRVDWRNADGRWSKGELLPDRVLEVSRYDREVFLLRFPPELRSTAEQLPFAVIKPPFEEGLASPVGQVWLQKSRSPADSAGRYHVVDRSGTLLREIRVPGVGRILAVGTATALVAEATREGTRLVTFPLPNP
jgi:hypothetical protein